MLPEKKSDQYPFGTYQGRRTRLCAGMTTVGKVNWNTAASLILQEARDEEERSNRWIAKVSGIPEVSVQRYLAGTRPVSVEHFAVIARALGRDPLVLFSAVEARVQRDQ